MRYHGVSGSSVGRALKCSWWARPEHDWPRETSRLAERGTEMHDLAEAILTTLRFRPTHSAIGAMAERAVEWLRSEDVHLAGVETAMYLDVETLDVRLEKTSGHRNYRPRTPTEIPMTADILGTSVNHLASWAARMDGDREYKFRDLVVVDWKTRPPGVRSRGNPELHADQLKTLGLAWWRRRAEPADGSKVRVFAVKLTPKKAMADEQVLDTADLMAHAKRLRDMLRLLPDSEPVAGDHCHFCPAKKACPAYAEREAARDTASSIFKGRR